MQRKITVQQILKRSLVLLACLTLVACHKSESVVPPAKEASPAPMSSVASPATEAPPAPASRAAPPFSSSLPLTLFEGVVLQKLTIIDQKGSATLLRGEAQNTSNKAVPWLDVRFKLLDKDGKTLGSAMAIVENLSANSHWGFEATLSEQGVVSAVVEHVGSRALR